MINHQQFLCACKSCGHPTSRQYARLHDGKCKHCVIGVEGRKTGERNDTYHDYIASGAYAAGVSFSDC